MARTGRFHENFKNPKIQEKLWRGNSRRREKCKKLLWESIEIIKQKLSNKVYRISLLDSFRQRADLFSDLDILIVMKSDKDFVERTKEIYSTLLLLYMQISSCYTPEGFEKIPFHEKGT
jgi:predicted nucleotidyltransferase